MIEFSVITVKVSYQSLTLCHCWYYSSLAQISFWQLSL